MDEDGDPVILFDDEEYVGGQVVQKRTFVNMVHTTPIGGSMSGLAPMMSIWNSITPPKFTGEVGGGQIFQLSGENTLG